MIGSRVLGAALATILLTGLGSLTACSSAEETKSEGVTAQTVQAASVSLVLHDENGTRVGEGSGILLAPRLVLTSAHLVAGKSRWTVTSADGKTKVNGIRGVTYDWMNYNSNKAHPRKHDVAVIYLDKPINLATYPTVATNKAAPGSQSTRIRGTGGGFQSLPGTLERVQGMPYEYLMTMPGGETLDTGGAVVNDRNEIVGLVTGRGMQTGKLHIARTDSLTAFLSPKVACGGRSAGLQTRTYGTPPAKPGCEDKGGGSAPPNGSNPDGSGGGGSYGTPGGPGSNGTPGGNTGSNPDGTPGGGLSAGDLTPDLITKCPGSSEGGFGSNGWNNTFPGPNQSGGGGVGGDGYTSGGGFNGTVPGGSYGTPTSGGGGGYDQTGKATPGGGFNSNGSAVPAGGNGGAGGHDASGNPQDGGGFNKDGTQVPAGGGGGTPGLAGYDSNGIPKLGGGFNSNGSAVPAGGAGWNGGYTQDRAPSAGGGYFKDGTPVPPGGVGGAGGIAGGGGYDSNGNPALGGGFNQNGTKVPAGGVGGSTGGFDANGNPTEGGGFSKDGTQVPAGGAGSTTPGWAGSDGQGEPCSGAADNPDVCPVEADGCTGGNCGGGFAPSDDTIDYGGCASCVGGAGGGDGIRLR